MFDNAQAPGDLAGWLPGGGHVLITSRQHRWGGIAAPVEVDVLARGDSVALLAGRVSGLAEAGRLADALGDLPLALAQAAEYLAETGMGAEEYLGLLRTRAREILDQGHPVSYPMSLAAATGLAADKLARDDPAAAELAGLCAFLAPEPVPVDLFTGAAAALSAELAARAADPIAWRQTLTQVSGHALARLDHRGLQMHRLIQAILRDRLTPAQAAATRERVEAILAASNPRDPSNPATWPRWAQLMPHLLVADLATSTDPGPRWLAINACGYLLARGDARSSHDLAANVHSQWRKRLGDDEETVMAMAHQLAWTLQNLARYTEARDLEQEVVVRARRVLGEDSRNTLIYANSLAISLHGLGDVQAARDLDQDTFDRRRRILGEDHPDTRRSARTWPPTCARWAREAMGRGVSSGIGRCCGRRGGPGRPGRRPGDRGEDQREQVQGGDGPWVWDWAAYRAASRPMPKEPAIRCQVLNSVFASPSWSGRSGAVRAWSSGLMTRPMETERRPGSARSATAALPVTRSRPRLATARTANPASTVTRTVSPVSSAGASAVDSPVISPCGSRARPVSSALRPCTDWTKSGSRNTAAQVTTEASVHSAVDRAGTACRASDRSRAGCSRCSAQPA